MHPAYVLKKPIVTEKATRVMGEGNHYTFLVDRRASKDQIKRAVEQMYGVQVIGVRTVNRKAGQRRLKYGWVRPGVTKKALVRLPEGQTIEVF
jgi:large subunit ribosomal protein L23